MVVAAQDLLAQQQPIWPDQAESIAVQARLKGIRPQLVLPSESRQLTKRLAAVAEGRAFLLQAGPCVESFDDTPESVAALLDVVIPMSIVLAYATALPVVKSLRLAGQLGKPRSSLTEMRGGVVLPSYRGDIVNAAAFTAEARQPNPMRMEQAYAHSERILEVVRRLAAQGYELQRMHEWTLDYIKSSSQGERYQKVVTGMDRFLERMQAFGVKTDQLPALREVELSTAHEALILDYERSLVRFDPNESAGIRYSTSAHMLWIGERTRGLNEAHVAFCASIANPIGVKLGPGATPSEVLGLCRRLNPDDQPGRLTFISRMGADAVQDALPPLIRAVRDSGCPVIWVCDPMHGNTVPHSSGKKTREFPAIVREVEGFFAVCRDEGVWPGGIHLEITGENVTECLGGNGPSPVESSRLGDNYTTGCDPRLNPEQSIELAFLVAELLAQF